MTSSGAESDNTLSRRAVLGRIGTAAAVGAAFTAPGFVGSDNAIADNNGQVAAGPAETTSIESLTRVEQNGDTLTGYGYLTSVVGLDANELFVSATRSEGTARFTTFGTATVTGRTILGNVFNVDAEGQLAVYFQSSGGADFNHPESFATGTLVALYTVVFQSINSVFAPNQGIFKLAADLRQQQAEEFSLSGDRQRFGRQNLRLRMQANGIGMHDAPRASLTIASNFVVIS
jgi:hypothetical protein